MLFCYKLNICNCMSEEYIDSKEVLEKIRSIGTNLNLTIKQKGYIKYLIFVAYEFACEECDINFNIDAEGYLENILSYESSTLYGLQESFESIWRVICEIGFQVNNKYSNFDFDSNIGYLEAHEKD